MKNWLVVAAFAFAAVVIGLFSALFGGLLAMLLVIPLMVLFAIFRDFRIGVIALAFLLPWASSPLLPQASGLNVINYLTAASLLSFALSAAFSREPSMPVPRPLIWYYLIPLTIGVLLAWPHLAEAVRNYAGSEAADGFGRGEFLRGRYLKPLGYVIFAFLLGNAVRRSKKPERFLIAFVMAALIPALMVFALIALNRVSLSDLQAQRNFMGPIGMHANEMAIMLAFALGPTLFLLTAIQGVVTRFLCGLAVLLIVSALLLTFSRGGFLAMMVMFGIFMVQTKRVTTFFVAVAVLLTAILFAPDAIKERLSTGVQSGAASYAVGNLNDPLTAGRVAVWQKLAPEVLKSPVWGRGLGSTAWSDLVRSGVYKANHPHNTYLAILLDLGLLGLGAILYWFYRLLRGYLNLYRAQNLSPEMRQFYAGAGAALLGVLVMNFTNGNYAPKPEQTFFWFSVGLLFAFWHVAEPDVFGKQRRKHAPENGKILSASAPA